MRDTIGFVFNDQDIDQLIWIVCLGGVIQNHRVL
jgi:hypothetical protein